MDRETRERLADRYGLPRSASIRQIINRAIRTLPGGNETLDALEALNAARNHAARAGVRDRVIATDAAIDRVESIREAMEDHIYRENRL